MDLYRSDSSSKQLETRGADAPVLKGTPFEGFITSVDYHRGAWWVIFSFLKDLIEKTKLVMYDDNWNEMRSWTFPNKILTDISPYSISGCSWKDDILYCTDFNKNKVYLFRAYETADTVTYMGTIPADLEGQGIAWDRSKEDILYGTRRQNNKVVIMRLV